MEKQTWQIYQKNNVNYFSKRNLEAFFAQILKVFSLNEFILLKADVICSLIVSILGIMRIRCCKFCFNLKKILRDRTHRPNAIYFFCTSSHELRATSICTQITFLYFASKAKGIRTHRGDNSAKQKRPK